MKTYTIYCLKEPTTGEIRYFGQTCQLIQDRFCKHLNAKPNWYVSRWIQSLRRENRIPICEVLMTGLEKWEADEEEIALIAWGRNKGFRLTNVTDGGGGRSGYVLSDKSRQQISEKHTGMRHSEETKKKISKIQIGKKASPETKQRMSDAHTGRIFSEESRQKMSKSGQGIRRNSISGYLGVRWHPRVKKWQAQIAEKYLGYFEVKEDAARAYDAAAVNLYGGSAKLNFPVD